jgi:NAD(P)-dependent dehydrogenase (short-subunit alcohol dehydrogenase family)/molybdopterin converting factor small subunit
MATVFIPAPFRDLSGGADRVDVGGKTVRQVVNALDERYPGMKARLCGADGALNPNVQVSVDGYVTRIGMLEKVGEASEVHFIPAIAGGQDALLRLDGKVALVTGAAQRIGRAIAGELAEQGARVVIADVQDEPGERAAREVGGAFVHADVGRHEDIRGMVEFAVGRFGRLDILVNNAHWEKHGTVVELDEADWDKSFDVLLKALYLGCKYAIPEMRKVGAGSIVNISSVHGSGVSDRYVTYQSAKAAVIHFTRQVAWDFGPERIRCNCICPGAIPTIEERERQIADPLLLEEVTLMKPLKRPGHPRDIARAALFFVSDLAEWVTGQALTVDGGEFMALSTVGMQRMRDHLRRHPERLTVER